MQEAVDVMALAVGISDKEMFIEVDVVLHRKFLFASHNQVLTQLDEPIEAVLRGRHSLNLVMEGTSAENMATHRAIVEPFASEDSSGTELALRWIIDIAATELHFPSHEGR